jgi:hypothetical protein
MAGVRIRKLGVGLLVVFSFAVVAQAQTIQVAVEDGSGGGGGAATVAQLNDDTFFDFNATLVSAADIDTAGELAAYNVVVLGGSGYNDADWTAAMSSALRTWVEAGGGAVFTGWGNYDVRTGEPTAADMEALFSGQNIPSVNEYVDSAGVIDVLIPAHPIVTGITNFAPGADYLEVNRFAPEGDDTVLAAIVGAASDISIAVKETVGSGGRTVYLGPIYLASTSGYSTTTLRSGDSDRLLEQAVGWAADASPLILGAIPTVSTYGMLILSMLIAAAGLAFLRFRF